MAILSSDKIVKPEVIQNGHEIIEDEVIENFRPLSVIGAGFSGIYCGV